MNRNYEYLSDEHAEYIKNLINKAAHKDKKYEIFGSKEHKYQLNETVSLEWVRKFEKQYQVELPEEYVFFITKVGNGGAGPYYGIEPLSFDKEYYNNLSKPSIYDDNYLQFYKEYKEYLASYKNNESEYNAFLEEKFEEMCDRTDDGVLNINTQGCTYDTLLVVNDSKKGEIVYIDWELDYPPSFIHMTFLEWYQGFFEEILAGYNIRGYGYNMLGDANELMEKYASADLEVKSKILNTFFKFKSVDQETLSFICHFDGVDDPCRLELILKFDEKKGLNFFEEFFNGNREQMKIAIEACSHIPDKYIERYYEKMLDCIYGDFDDDLKMKALIFIRDIKKLSAGDLLAFVKNIENSAEIRKTCMYAIGAAKDKKKYVDTFVDILNTVDSEQVLLETLITLRNVKSKKIAQTYEALIPKYQDSDEFMIVRNMEYYLKHRV